MKLLILLVLLQNCYVFTPRENRPIMKNYFPALEDEINFGRLAHPKFQYTISSCVQPEYCAHNLFDSNPHTEWVSSKELTDEWIIIDFGSKRLMNKLELEISANSSPVPEVGVQVLYRGEWKTIWKFTNPTGKQTYFFGNIDASTLKIYFTKLRPVAYSIADLKILLNESILTGISTRLTNYIFPISRGLLPEDDYSLPGAPRKYRNGIHKGLDISYKLNSKGTKELLTKSTPILAIQDGVVVRADWDYKPMTLEEYTEITTYNQSNPVTYVHRDFGGRQVWVDHGQGVMSAYNHLSSIETGIEVGKKVKKGEKIGTVGNSGLKAEATGTNEQIHLHLEIWIDGEFLGNDLSPIQTRKLLQLFFSG